MPLAHPGSRGIRFRPRSINAPRSRRSAPRRNRHRPGRRSHGRTLGRHVRGLRITFAARCRTALGFVRGKPLNASIHVPTTAVGKLFGTIAGSPAASRRMPPETCSSKTGTRPATRASIDPGQCRTASRVRSISVRARSITTTGATRASASRRHYRSTRTSPTSTSPMSTRTRPRKSPRPRVRKPPCRSTQAVTRPTPISTTEAGTSPASGTATTPLPTRRSDRAAALNRRRASRGLLRRCHNPRFRLRRSRLKCLSRHLRQERRPRRHRRSRPRLLRRTRSRRRASRRPRHRHRRLQCRRQMQYPRTRARHASASHRRHAIQRPFQTRRRSSHNVRLTWSRGPRRRRPRLRRRSASRPSAR